eukprot:6261201-Pyramimonas_sp.AAC.1
MIHGDEVLIGAAEYIANRGHDRVQRLGLNAEELWATAAQCDAVLRDNRRSWRELRDIDHREYTAEQLQDVTDKVKTRRASAGLPYASVKLLAPAHATFLLA